jgi:hypothetical protein
MIRRFILTRSHKQEFIMRLLGLAIAAFLIAVPALAQNAQSYANYRCSQHVPCPNDAPATASVAADLYANAGNACVKEGFGYSSGSGYFDTTAGLDGRACLTPIPGAFPKGAGAQLTPVCCVVDMGNSVCVFRCDLTASQ